ncbi:hypothetical protein amrb99_97830 [Actinomadura sp. RB99]|uniref:helix-turn-helix domain-containing protein n=1 Tax=Actinomadura sp. RB99 TaxID=2691577 RepID=UPI0019C831F9|nr:hypothetical protein [Actinomadura sp. RB99]
MSKETREPVGIPDPEKTPMTDLATVAALAGIGLSTAYDAARRGDFPTRRIGRRWIVPTAPLLEYLGLTPAAK